MFCPLSVLLYIRMPKGRFTKYFSLDKWLPPMSIMRIWILISFLFGAPSPEIWSHL